MMHTAQDSHTEADDLVSYEVTIPIFDTAGLREKVAGLYSQQQSHVVPVSRFVTRAEDESITHSFDEALLQVLAQLKEHVHDVDLKSVSVSLSIDFDSFASPSVHAVASAHKLDWSRFRGLLPA